MKRLLSAVVLISAVAVGVQPAHGQASQIREIIEGFLGEPSGIPGAPSPEPAPAQPSYPRGALTRAMNLARQAAERQNGGLNVYRAESSMYGPAIDSPYKDNGDGTLTFTFLGGAPTLPPTVQSIVTVAVDGSLVTVDYNGPIQTAG